MRFLRKFLTLTPRERRLLAQAIGLLILVRLGLGRVSFATLRRLLTGRDAEAARPLPLDGALADEVVWAVERAGRRIPGPTTCLTRALTVQALLALHGHPSRLHIGVAQGPETGLEAHAWIECDGRIVVGGSRSEIGQFTPLAAFETAGR
jgi:hypothetical protein